jgi:hypothetical protein
VAHSNTARRASYGDARYFGSLGGRDLTVTEIRATADGSWLTGHDGTRYPFQRRRGVRRPSAGRPAAALAAIRPGYHE